MGLDLRDLRKPLDEVTFPNGVTHRPIPFGPVEYQLWRDMKKETDARTVGDMGMQIIRACYPTVTDDDILDCDGDMLLALAAYPGGKIEQVQAALKNDVAVVVTAVSQPPHEAPVTAPSSPRKSGNTSVSRSRKRSAETSGTSTTASPTAAPNSSGTASTTLKNPDESTPYAVKWTTSTAPA